MAERIESFLADVLALRVKKPMRFAKGAHRSCRLRANLPPHLFTRLGDIGTCLASLFLVTALQVWEQRIEQRLRLLQIARVEPFRKPAVNRSKQFARLLRLALVTPEARKAHCGAQFV